ncbi:MAG: hypothetical protein KF687_11285 [Cyclobacteriaceae bacterium]|nr:hypothetical protein [Cyclobacteriaceae bacterium]
MRLLASLLVLLLLHGCAKTEKDHRITLFDEYLSGHAKYFQFNGNVLVAEHGEIIYQKSFGLADFDSNRPINDSSVLSWHPLKSDAATPPRGFACW